MVALSSLYLCAVLTAATPDIVLLEFYSPSCGPCQSMQGTIDRLKKDGYPIQQINVETAHEAARQFQIRHVPTCVLLVGGKEVSRLDGAQSRDAIESVFQQARAAQQAAAQTAAQAASQAEEFVVRGQSPEARRGLGLFNRLSGNKQSDAGAPPMQITGGTAAPASAAPSTEFGRDDAFSRRSASTTSDVAPVENMPLGGVATPPANSLPTNAFPSQAVPTHSEPAQTAEFKQYNSPSERALHSTVRLKIEDPAGVSFGTGTIIDELKDEYLIVTCGHIFRDSKGQGKINVDLHTSLASKPVPGQLISFDLTRDIALVSIRPGVTVPVAPVASDPRKIVAGLPVFSIGCDHGHEASVRESRITAVNKYNGSPNYTASGMPVQGRSGGGLFTSDGTLIGICNAADQQGDEGLYAALGTIHWQLDQIGQTAIYQKGAVADAIAATDSRDQVPAPAAADIAGMSNLPTMAPPASSGAAMLAGNNQEIILFVRDKNQPSARGEAIVIDRPTPELLEVIGRASRGGATLSGSQPQPTGMRSLPEEPPTIVRGQNK